MYMYLCGETVSGKKRQDDSNSTASLSPLPQKINKQKINKQKERKHLGKNERTNRNETNRPETRKQKKKTGLTNSRDSTLGTCTLTQERFYLPLSRCLTHARTHNAQVREKKTASIHPSIHPFFLDYITQKGIPPRHKKSYRARNSRPGNQSERERNIFILSRPYHRVRLHLTSARLISAHRSRRRRRRRRELRERRRLSNQLYCAASDPIQFSHPSIQLKGM